MSYDVFCRKTNKLLAVYHNEETLKSLDTNKCYYEKSKSMKEKITKANSATNVQSASSTTSRSDDLLSPTSPMYHATLMGGYSGSSSCSASSCDSSSSSSSSDSSSSSSSCD